MLTNSATADTIITTSGNDTVNGPTGTVVNGDLIIDQTTTDNLAELQAQATVFAQKQLPILKALQIA